MLSIYKYIILILSLIGLSSCMDSPLTNDERIPDTGSDELPLEFIINMPREFESRAYIDSYGNERFSEDDIIHILGIFNMEYRTEGGGTMQGIESRYGALRYNGRYWEPVAGSKLRWPAVSTSGTFTAYYISESNGILTGTTATETYSLSDLTETTDPLGAQSKENIVYGAAVELDFYHLCARLTLTDLEQIPSDYFWFTSSNPKNPESLESFEFNNAFKISLGEDEESQPTLNFEFCQMNDPQYDKIFITSPYSMNQQVNQDGTVTESANVTYYLQPGYYDEFELIYPAGEKTTYSYLQYNYNNIPDNIEGSEITKTPPNLLANHPYTLSITKSPGIEIKNPPKPDEWDESNVYYDVDVEEFLKAIYNKTDYFYEETQILEKTATGTRLLHNVNFKNFDYRNFEDKDFRPNNNDGSVFDGGYHYIRDLGSPLFRYNYGTIQNLGIKSVNATGISYESDNENDDMSRHGSLCMWNRVNATIDNIRVSENVMLTIYVKCINAGEETHNIGGVVGSNTGTMSNVSLSGNFTINISGLSANTPDFSDGKNYPVNASVLIGGLVGQNAAQGSISEISALNGAPVLSFNIINTCKGPLGSYSLGGMCGESTGFINDIILSNINIDSSLSNGVTSYIGGITGQLSVSENTTASLSSCYVNGQVKAGISNPYGEISSGSYIGGISGTLFNVPVTNCNVGISVEATQEAGVNVLYATGGAFGRIRASDPTVITDLNIAGNRLIAPNNPLDPEIKVTNYIGSFAGLVPLGQSWKADYSSNDISLKSFYGISEIGGNLSSE
ncbi:MAG: fimbrillin family protein [Muribaculaceae bacterium]|nr:fimbrillin family protein [Muribaculaceae bacterium]